MDYDLRSQIRGPCIAGANSPLPRVKAAMESYIKLGIKPDNLVLGVPWYGYVYQCIDPKNNTICPIKHVPFINTTCSDAAGTQVPYSGIMELLLYNATTGRIWDSSTSSPYFDYQDDTGNMFQVYFWITNME
jgi:di-N-acetylchitobiase